MPQPAKHFYDFGPFRIDLVQRELLENGQRVSLSLKAFETLRVLVENHGSIIERDELMQKVWPDAFVEEANLTVNIFLLRKVLNKGLNGAQAIETIPRRGYRFVAPIREADGEPGGEALARPGLSSTSLREAAQALGLARAIPGGPLADSSEPAVAEVTSGRSDSRPHAARSRGILIAAVVFALLAGLVVWWVTHPSPLPRMLGLSPLTQFGRADAFDEIVTDGARLYFVAVKGAERRLMQVSVNGGVPVEIQSPFASPTLFGISADRSELLVGSTTHNEQEVPVWALPLVSRSPRRLGSVIAHDASWSPDGRSMVYGHGLELYLAGADGSQPHQLATLPGRAWAPRFSPDGQVVRFSMEQPRSGPFSLWEIRVDGTRPHPLLPDWKPKAAAWGLGESAGVWTPDDRYFLFRSRQMAEGIWAIREDGSIFRPSTHRPVNLYEGPASLDFYSLTISPDGKRVYFVGQEERYQLVRYDAKIGQFLPYFSEIAAQFTRPVEFSRNGQWIVYGQEQGLYRSRIDGSERLQLAGPLRLFGCPRFTPDGRHVAFQASDPSGLIKIFIVSADGAELKQVTSGNFVDAGPDWSPDGRTLLFQRRTPTPAPEACEHEQYACLLNLDTKSISRLPGSEQGDCFRWSPDGRYIVATRPASSNLSSLDLFDLQTQAWRHLAKPMWCHNLYWSRDSKHVYGQVAGTEQRVFRVRIGNQAFEWVTSPNLSLPPDVASWGFAGLAPDGSPLGVLLRRNGDVYALDVDLP